MKKILLGISAVAVILVAAAFSLPADKATLRLNLPAGKAYTTQMKMAVNMYGDEAMTSSIMSMNMDQSLNMKVLGRENEVNKLEVTISRVKLNQNMQGMSITYDSDLENQNDMMAAMMHQQMSPILNKRGTVAVDARGKTVEPLVIADADPSVSEQMSSGVENMFMELPEKPVGAGDSWESDMDIQNTTIKVKYTVEKLDKKFVYIKISGTAVVTAEEASEAGLTDIKFNGAITLDRATGLTTKSSISQFFESDSPTGEGKAYSTVAMESTTIQN